MHHLSAELSSKEAMERLGVYGRPFKVVRWPVGRPDLAHCVQQFEVHERVPTKFCSRCWREAGTGHSTSAGCANGKPYKYVERM